jgi:hypothetical protein
MRRLILSSVPCLKLGYFSTLSQKRHDFGGKIIEHKMCVLTFSTNYSEKFIILRRIQQDAVINLKSSSCKMPVILSDFDKTSVSSTDYRKILK